MRRLVERRDGSGRAVEQVDQSGEGVAEKAGDAQGYIDPRAVERQMLILLSELKRGLAGSLGVTVAQVAQSLRPAFAGIDAGDWVDPTGETRDVTVRLTPEARRRTIDLERLPLVITGAEGKPVTLPLAPSQVGRTPSNASAWAMSSPPVRMFAVPHAERARRAG